MSRLKQLLYDLAGLLLFIAMIPVAAVLLVLGRFSKRVRRFIERVKSHE